MTLLMLLNNHRGPVTYVTDTLSFTTSQAKLGGSPSQSSFDKPKPRLA